MKFLLSVAALVAAVAEAHYTLPSINGGVSQQPTPFLHLHIPMISTTPFLKKKENSLLGNHKPL